MDWTTVLWILGGLFAAAFLTGVISLVLLMFYVWMTNRSLK
jgi:hypothetical protein